MRAKSNEPLGLDTILWRTLARLKIAWAIRTTTRSLMRWAGLALFDPDQFDDDLKELQFQQRLRERWEAPEDPRLRVRSALKKHTAWLDR